MNRAVRVVEAGPDAINALGPNRTGFLSRTHACPEEIAQRQIGIANI